MDKHSMSDTIKDLGTDSKNGFKNSGEVVKKDYDQTKADMKNIANSWTSHKDEKNEPTDIDLIEER